MSSNLTERNLHQSVDQKVQRAGSLHDRLLRIIRNLPDESAFELGEWLARFLFSNHCGIYRCDDLENHLASRLGPSELPPPPQLGKELHRASELYGHGGHTRLLRAIVRQSTGMPHVLLTRQEADARLVSLSGAARERLHSINLTSTAVEQAREIALKAAGFEQVILHIHPDDVVAAAAMQWLRRAARCPRISFFNHSDHTFSVGIGAADRVLEISTFGWALREARGTIATSTFVGLPIAVDLDLNYTRAPAAALMMSAGSAYKFKPTSSQSMPRLLRKALAAAPTAEAVVIGPRAHDVWWWRTRIQGPRLRLMSSVNHEQYLGWLKKARVYIDSMPITGGTAFTEALLHGVPVAGMRGDTYGYGLADCLRTDSEAELLALIQALMSEDPQALAFQEQVRREARAFHAPAAVASRVTSCATALELLPPPAAFSGSLPPARSFEARWRHQFLIRPTGFRKSPPMRLVRQLLIALTQEFGWVRSNLPALLTRALHARLFRQTGRI